MRHLILLLSILPLFGRAQKVDTVKFSSTTLNQKRDILIYKPAQYEKFSDKKFEVVYVLDAQSRANFDLVHSTLQFIGGQQYAFIVVGITSPTINELKQSRSTDFLPTPENEKTTEEYNGFVGGADKFMAFIQSELMPYVDKNYRTLPEKIIIGHSNGGAFVSHVLLSNPDMFDAYIAISPNYAYDEEQLVKRFATFSPGKLKKNKFFYVSSANETAAIGWTGWEEGNKKVVDMLKSPAWASKIHFVNKEFKPENHGTTYPVSVFYGLKSFLDYQYRTAANVIAYYEGLADKKIVTLTPATANRAAYECFVYGKNDDALALTAWGIKHFPEATELYASRSEFYEKAGNIAAAKQAVQAAIGILKKSEKEAGKKEYDDKVKFFNDRLKKLDAAQ